MAFVVDPAATRVTLHDGVADPVFILATPRAFSSVVCAMLGQHPQMYGLPELHLFGDETMTGWSQRASGESFPMAHGLLRAVAELCFGGQTEATVTLARAWLRRRRDHTTGMILEELARAAAPAAVIEKSPSTVYEPESLKRLRRFFPRSRFLHLVRHPRGYGTSVIRYLETLARPEYQRRDVAVKTPEAPEWIRRLAYFSAGERDQLPVGAEPVPDPEHGWYRFNANVVAFLETVPAGQAMRLRGEDLLREPDRMLANVANWIGVRTDPRAIEAMKHPEHSPFARFGPSSARSGNDIFFLQRPAVRQRDTRPESLAGPLPWRGDGRGFSDEVIDLAVRFGYA